MSKYIKKKQLNQKALESAKKYAEVLKANKINYKYLYLFGSYAKNNYHKYSDIDICIVTDETRSRMTRKFRSKLWDLRDYADDRIQPYPILIEDFKDPICIMADQVKTSGVLIDRN